jgi:thiol-disulfide isomerase/thioredoxin
MALGSEIDTIRAMTNSARLATSAVLALASLLTVAPARAGGDWNDGGIAWQPYDAGLALAKKEKKPVCLVFFTEWCPHCANYSKVFHDPAVVAKSKSFVMIRLDKDKNDELSGKYSLDGQYIPRTFFLSPSGELEADVHAPREQYKYFYDEHDPKGVLAGMDAALAKAK